jgi:myo-inositol-1(or 4)-monophosphatase
MNLENLCKKVVAVAEEASEFIAEQARQFKPSQIEIKGKNDLVSYVDRETEALIVSQLKLFFPEGEFIAEENPDFKNLTNQPYHWIIDPLDGTTNFLHGLPIFSISIGLMHYDKMVLGVVHEVNRKETFYAWERGGAYCNGERIYATQGYQMKDSLLATGFPYRDFDRFPAYLDVIRQLMYQTHGLRRMGSAAVDLAYVAMGRFQGFFEYGLNSWDVAAGALLVQEAGGTVTDFKGENDYVFGKQILAAGSVHAEMLQTIQAYWYPENKPKV